MRHRAAPRFWHTYRQLPDEVRELADRCYAMMRARERHPSLRLKKAGRFWSVRVGLHHRALAVERGDDRFWIGTHAEYDNLLGR